MSFFNFLKGPSPEQQAAAAASVRRQSDIIGALQSGRLPKSTAVRMQDAKAGRTPWISTLTPAELRIVRSHGIRPIATVSATCWLHYGWSWTRGHAEGWHTALQRLKQEAVAAGANAILDVKMRTIKLDVDDSMDFTLTGTAVLIESCKTNNDPIVVTVPALEFVRLIEADVVPTGIAIGAHYEWLNDWYGNADGEANKWQNGETRQLSTFLNTVRRRAYADLRDNARTQGNGVLAHINFTQIFKREFGENDTRYLGRHIAVATIVDANRKVAFPHEIQMVVDLCDSDSPLLGTTPHHQSYAELTDEDGAI